jgi:hypothetical protein
VGECRRNELPRLIPETAAFTFVLAATQDVANQTFAMEKTFFVGRKVLCSLFAAICGTLASEAGLNQRPAGPDPLTVTAVYQLVRAAAEPAFWSILA